jgi:tetratricopeptide (TPR) repeat protein
VEEAVMQRTDERSATRPEKPEPEGAPAKVPLRLVGAVLAMTLVVLALGGAVVAIRLRPEGAPSTKAERDISMAEQQVQADPQDEWAHVGLGIALQETGRDAEAKQAFEDALALNPHNWRALFELGLIAMPTDPERAMVLLAKAAKYAPRTSRAAAFVALGDLEMQAGDFEAARKAYRGAVADIPYLFDARVGLAKALEALGDEKGALEQYQEAIRYDPGNQEVTDAIARLQGKAD